MGCVRKTKVIVKGIAKQLKPLLVKRAVNIVTALNRMSDEEPLFWTNSMKRKVALGVIKQEAEDLQVEIKESTTRLLMEFAVEAVKGPEDESDLGDDDSGDLEAA